MRWRVYVASLLLFGMAGSSLAMQTTQETSFNETVIRVLIVADTGLTTTEIDDALAHLLIAWGDLEFGLTQTVSIEFANFAFPLPAPSGLLTGTAQQQLDKLRVHAATIVPPLVSSIRDVHGADIVMGLSKGMSNSACGLAIQEEWAGIELIPSSRFDPKESTGDLDLRGKEDYYVGVAVVRVNVAKCDEWVLAHEFGHLLGGGHSNIPYPFQALEPDSHATATIPFFGLRFVTTLVNVAGSDACDDVVGQFLHFCIHFPLYSNGNWGGLTPQSDYNNEKALVQTAMSVANYRFGLGTPPTLPTCSDNVDNDGDQLVDGDDPDCAVCNSEFCPSPPPAPPPGCSGTQTPINFFAEIEQVCIPGTTRTAWRISWDHICPGSVSQYRIWAQQPVGNIEPTYRWTTPYREVYLWIQGSSARIDVQACNFSSCGAPSVLGPIIHDIC